MSADPQTRRHHWEIYPPHNLRLDRTLYQLAGQPCFLTIRAAPNLAPFRDPRLARIAVSCLLGQREKSQCQLDVYCVMPDHIHLVITPMVDGASSLDYGDRFKGWCGRRLRMAGWEGGLWQKRSYDHLIRSEENLHDIVAYILANPVRKGLAATVEEYPWSGIPEPLMILGGDDPSQQGDGGIVRAP